MHAQLTFGQLGYITLNSNAYKMEPETWFGYWDKVDLPDGTYRVVITEGQVPNEIVLKGWEAVKEYAKQKVNEAIKEQSAVPLSEVSFDLQPDYPLEVTYEDVILQGRIISAANSSVAVELLSPYHGYSTIHFGFASAMNQRYVFNRNRQFTDEALDTAKMLLAKIYRVEKAKKETS